MRSNQATDKISRLLKKRELLAFYILCKGGEREYNLGKALDIIMKELILSRKVAWNVLRRLIRLGLLRRINNVYVKCIDFSYYFDALLRSYREGRVRRMGTV